MLDARCSVSTEMTYVTYRAIDYPEDHSQLQPTATADFFQGITFDPQKNAEKNGKNEGAAPQRVRAYGTCGELTSRNLSRSRFQRYGSLCFHLIIGEANCQLSSKM